MKKLLSILCVVLLLSMIAIPIACAEETAESSDYQPIKGQLLVKGNGSYTMTSIDDPAKTQTKKISGADTFEWQFEEPGEYRFMVRSNEIGETAIYKVTYSVFDQQDQLYLITTLQDSASGAKPAEIDYRHTADAPSVLKVVEGNPSSAGTFRFTMTANNPNCPMPEGSVSGRKEVSIVGPGAVQFGDIVFREKGEFAYTIRELNDKAEGYTYDDGEYSIIYTVFEQGDSLSCSRTYLKNGQVLNDQTKITITNVYKPSRSTPDQPPGKTGDESHIGLYIAVLAAAVIIVIVILVVMKKKSGKGEKHAESNVKKE